MQGNPHPQNSLISGTVPLFLALETLGELLEKRSQFTLAKLLSEWNSIVGRCLTCVGCRLRPRNLGWDTHIIWDLREWHVFQPQRCQKHRRGKVYMISNYFYWDNDLSPNTRWKIQGSSSGSVSLYQRSYFRSTSMVRQPCLEMRMPRCWMVSSLRMKLRRTKKGG